MNKIPRTVDGSSLIKIAHPQTGNDKLGSIPLFGESIGIASAGLGGGINPTQTIQGKGETTARTIGQTLPEWADDLAAIVPKGTAAGRPARLSATGWSLARRLRSRTCRREQDGRPQNACWRDTLWLRRERW
jgi:hypothetical protein